MNQFTNEIYNVEYKNYSKTVTYRDIRDSVVDLIQHIYYTLYLYKTILNEIFTKII